MEVILMYPSIFVNALELLAFRPMEKRHGSDLINDPGAHQSLALGSDTKRYGGKT